jgi:hypothetical protein
MNDYVRELFAKHSVPLEGGDVWMVQGNPVVKHKALERLAGKLGIWFELPQVMRSERDEAVVLVRGYVSNDTWEWSFGEACIGQNYKVSGNQAAYPWAMAEKRAKDRVIIKLAGLHGAYSSEDDFDREQPKEDEASATSEEPRYDLSDCSEGMQKLRRKLGRCRTHIEVQELMVSNSMAEALAEVDADEASAFRVDAQARWKTLKESAATIEQAAAKYAKASGRTA